MSKYFFLLWLLSCLSACSALPFPTPATGNLQASHIIAPSELLQQSSHSLQALNESADIIYFQNFGGDITATGAGAVLAASATSVAPLLGIFGEAYILNEIEQQTLADALQLKNKLPFNPARMLASSLHAPQTKPPINLSTGSHAEVVLSPYIYLSKTGDNNLLIACVMLAESTDLAGAHWRVKYTRQLALKIALSELSQGLTEKKQQQVKTRLQAGFNGIAALYQQDRAGALSGKQALSLNSEFFSPRFHWSVSAEMIRQTPHDIIIRSHDGVYQLPRSMIKSLTKQDDQAR